MEKMNFPTKRFAEIGPKISIFREKFLISVFGNSWRGKKSLIIGNFLDIFDIFIKKNRFGGPRGGSLIGGIRGSSLQLLFFAIFRKISETWHFQAPKGLKRPRKFPIISAF